MVEFSALKQLRLIKDSGAMVDEKLEECIERQESWTQENHTNLLFTSCSHCVKKSAEVPHGNPQKNYDTQEYECPICQRPGFLKVDIYSSDVHECLNRLSDTSQKANLENFEHFMLAAADQADTFKLNPFTIGTLYDSDQLMIFNDELLSGDEELIKLTLFLQQGFKKLNIDEPMNQSCRHIMIVMQSLKSMLNYTEIISFAAAVKRFAKVYSGLYTLSRMLIVKLMSTVSSSSPSPRSDFSSFFGNHAKRLSFSVFKALATDDKCDIVELFSIALESGVTYSLKTAALLFA